MTAGKWIIVSLVGAAILTIFVCRDLEGQKQQKVRAGAQQAAAESRPNLVAAGQLYYRALSVYDSLHGRDIRKGTKPPHFPKPERMMESYYLHEAMNGLAKVVFKDSTNLDLLRFLPTEMPELPPVTDKELSSAVDTLHIINFIIDYQQKWFLLKCSFDSTYDIGWPRPNR